MMLKLVPLAKTIRRSNNRRRGDVDTLPAIDAEEQEMKKKAGWGSTVSIYYEGSTESGEHFDERTEGAPLTVVLGTLSLPQGIEEALVGRHAGDEMTVDIPPERGFGIKSESLVQWYPRLMIPHGENLQVDDVIFRTNAREGTRQPAIVTQATADAVLLDFNHPLAGKTLHYWLKIAEVD